MLSVEQAQAEILGRVRPLPTERVDIVTALGRVLAEPIHSTRRIPPWPNSSMDGYAIRAADARPRATLRVVDRVIAGSLPTRAVGAGEAVRIFTGAPLPMGADAVVPQEDVDAHDSVVTLRGIVSSGAYVRPAGEDVREGDLVLEPGRAIGPAEIGILATLGRTQVTVGLFVRPMLLAMQGRRDSGGLKIRATALAPIVNRGSRRGYLRVVLKPQNGRFGARLTGDQGSGILRSMVSADGLAVLRGDASISSGGEVEVIVLRSI